MDLTPRSNHAAGLPSGVGLGCAGLMRIPSRRGRNRLVQAALDLGVVHFDVARMYGLGAAERELGRALGYRRDSVTIASKFGLEASRLASTIRPVQGPLRAVLNHASVLRRSLKHGDNAFRDPLRYDARTAARHLDSSLREIGTDYLDVLFVHGAAPGDDLEVEELKAFFEDARSAGKICHWGVSTDAVFALELTRQLGGDIPQLRRSLVDASDIPTERIDQPTCLFGVVQPSLEVIVAAARSSSGTRRFSEQCGADLTSAATVSELLVAEAVAAAQGGKVIVGTTSWPHLASAVCAPSRYSPQAIEAFRAFVAELAPDIEGGQS